MTTKHHAPDYVLILTFLAILVFGVVMLSSVSSAIAYDRFQDNYYYLKRQIILGVIPGVILFYFLSRIDYHRWRKLALPFLLISIGLLILVLIPGVGVGIGGARRWLNLGGFTFQPSEAVKLTFLIYLATWLAHRGRTAVKDFSYGLLPFLSLVGLIAFLMILQPDVGTMVVIVLISLIVYFIAGARWTHLLGVGAVGALALGVLIKIAPYRAARLTAFLNPDVDPLGISYQINQALLAVGSGGLFGLGLGASRQKYLFLPEVIGDSIFAVIAEELGFGGAIFVLALLLVLLFRLFSIARESRDNFGKLLISLFAVIIFLQISVNIGMNIGLVPVAGIPLPLLSYGGSSLVSTLAMLGIAESVWRINRQRIH